MGALSDDKLDFYAGDLGPAQKLVLGAASAATPRLLPGRYRVAIVGLGANTAWLHAAGFKAVPDAAVADVPNTPFVAAAPSFEINVRRDHNDQIVGIMSAGAATAFLTPTSRQPK